MPGQLPILLRPARDCHDLLQTHFTNGYAVVWHAAPFMLLWQVLQATAVRQHACGLKHLLSLWTISVLNTASDAFAGSLANRSLRDAQQHALWSWQVSPCAAGVNSTELWNNLALCCFYASQHDMALSCFERAFAVADDSNLADVWYNIGQVAVGKPFCCCSWCCMHLQLSFAQPAHPMWATDSALETNCILTVFDCTVLRC